MRYLLLVVVLLGIVFAAYLALAPAKIDPVAWTPPANPGLTGPYSANEKLKGATLAKVRPGVGPEDVALGNDGFIYTGLENGSVVRLRADGSVPPEVFAETGGRPLGMAFAPSGELVVADSKRGLLSVSPDGTVVTLTTRAADQPIAFADDVAIAGDGTVYFSDASSRGPDTAVQLDSWEAKATGRLLAYDPKTRATRVLLSDLRFANGVAMGPGDAYVLVTETLGYRVTRYWLAGDKAGTHDVFVDGLPGLPDNISFDGKGTFWVALVSPRNEWADPLAERPVLRKMLFNLFTLFGFPNAGSRYGWVIGLDADGKVTANLQDPSGRVHTVTSVNRYGDQLVLGSIAMDAIATIAVP